MPDAEKGREGSLGWYIWYGQNGGDGCGDGGTVKEGVQRIWMERLVDFPLMAAAFDGDGRVVMWGRQCERVTGYRAEQVVGNSRWLELVFGDSADEVRRGWELWGRDGRRWVWPVRCRDGGTRQVVWYELSGWLRATGWAKWGIGVEADGERSGVGGGDAAGQSEGGLREMFENMSVGVYRTTPDGQVLVANRALLEMLGFSSLEQLQRGNLERKGFGRESPRAEFKRQIERDGRVVGMRSVWIRRDGKPLVVRENARIVRDAAGRTLYYEGVVEDVTQQDAIERALVARDRWHRTLMKYGASVYTILDETGRILYESPSIETVYGWKPEELVGTNIFDKVHPDDLAYARDKFKDLVSKRGSVIRVEVRWKHKDGTWRTADVTAANMLEDEHLKGIVITSIDITERKKIEQEISKFKTVLDQAGYGVAIADIEGKLIYVNAAFARMHGYGPEEVIGRDLSIFHTEQQMKRVRQLNARLIRGDGYIGEEVWHVRRDGSVFVALMNGTVIKDARGRPVYVAATAVDITERKRLEQTLRESEERYRTVVESAGEAIAVVDEQGRFLFVNRRGARWLGGKPEDCIGKTMWELFLTDDARRQMETVREVIRSGCGRTTRGIITVKGQQRWYETTVSPLRDCHGRISAAMVVARDIHEQKTAEEELERYREQMVQAERLASAGVLSAMVAHELTQPLTVIRLAIENAMAELGRGVGVEQVQQSLGDGLEGVAHAMGIVERFRDFARKGSTGMCQRVPLSLVAERVVRLLEGAARRARLTIEVDDLGRLGTIEGSARDLEQLFFVLMQNAIQAAKGEREHRLHVSGEVLERGVEIRFADDCGGIAPEHVDKIFEPFFTTKAAGKGTGLGLCIAERIARRTGGEIRVENQAGYGATFVVRLGCKASER